jgi:hypothetical protein
VLIKEPKIMEADSVLSMIAAINGNSGTAKELSPGIYEIGHFGASDFMSGYNKAPALPVAAYGVCDNVEQLLQACPELEASERKFVITLTSVRKEAQHASGGWRWGKWGPYIGTQNPQCDYLYDEPYIEQVYCYRIYEKN